MKAARATEDREIVITRVFDAPRDLVFEAWTDPRHIASWWGPKGFTTTIHEIDVRPGGVWRFVMHGPDGVDYQNQIVYLEIVKPERLVYDHGDENEPKQFRVTVTFTEQGAKTRLTMRSLFPSAAARDEVVTKYHAIEGGNQTLDRFAEQLLQMAQGEVVITRVFDAPRELIFKAWTEPERVQRWWGPGGFTTPLCELDVRPGGAIRIHMRGPDGTIYPMAGVYREIVPPERLVFTSAPLDEKGNPVFEVLNTVMFAEQGGQTELTLRARPLMLTPAAAPMLRYMEHGWNQSLDRLAYGMAANGGEFSIARVFNAPRDLVWKAVTESERLMHWWGPKGFTALICKVDLRPGGAFHYCLRSPDGREMWGRWIYREIAAPERLVTVVSFTDAEGNTARHPISPTWPLEILHAMTLSEHDGKTTLTLYAVPINATEEEHETFNSGHDGMERGFTGTLDQLDEYLASVQGDQS